MLEKVKVGDLAIFKNGEESRIIQIDRSEHDISLGFDEPVIIAKDIMPSRWWLFRYNGEIKADVNDKNNIVKIIHMEEG